MMQQSSFDENMFLEGIGYVLEKQRFDFVKMILKNSFGHIIGHDQPYSTNSFVFKTFKPLFRILQTLPWLSMYPYPIGYFQS